MPITDLQKSSIEISLQNLLDEGWESGRSYASIEASTDPNIKDEYWINAERYEERLIQQALRHIVKTLLGEDIGEYKGRDGT